MKPAPVLTELDTLAEKGLFNNTYKEVAVNLHLKADKKLNSIY